MLPRDGFERDALPAAEIDVDSSGHSTYELAATNVDGRVANLGVPNKDDQPRIARMARWNPWNPWLSSESPSPRA